MTLRRLALRAVAVSFAAVVAACTVGEGEGRVFSDDLRAGSCFRGPYDLAPTFFASNPYMNTQTLRVQRKDDMIENSDGVEIVVEDTNYVRSKLGTPLKVGLSPEVTPPGVPIVKDPDPPVVHLVHYLYETCHGSNVALYAVDGTITFKHLFSGNVTEEDGDQKLIEFDFDVTVADPRDQPKGGGPIPDDKKSRLVGTGIRYFFQRGQPAQPFP